MGRWEVGGGIKKKKKKKKNSFSSIKLRNLLDYLIPNRVKQFPSLFKTHNGSLRQSMNSLIYLLFF